jgi:hypothetical protein
MSPTPRGLVCVGLVGAVYLAIAAGVPGVTVAGKLLLARSAAQCLAQRDVQT